jgi:hypothetical protein
MEANNKDKFDRWLDSALQNYGNVQPRVGLESRIMANLAAQKAGMAARRRWWLAVVTAAATTVVAIAAWFGSGSSDQGRFLGNFVHKAPSTKQPKSEVNVLPVTKQITAKAAAQPRLRPHYEKVFALPDSPKLSQFPSPQPLSKQEQMLSLYVREFPREAMMVAEAQAQAAAERELAELAADKTPEIDSSQQER